MNVKCDYCGAMVDETSKTCPKCGAPLSGANRVASEQPKTIEELQEWYKAHNLPPEEITRFFIGKNIREPKAFGIYKNEVGDCVVYKNKESGERAVRYQGADEAYAVNELYQRLRAEIADQKGNSGSSKTNGGIEPIPIPPKKKLSGCGCAAIVAAVLFVGVALMAIFDHSAPNGYYNYEGTEYYCQGSSWYRYDPATDAWFETETMKDLINDETADKYSYSGHEGTRFEETNWYDAGSSYDDDDDWDSDDDWSSSSSSWSSSSTDWDSDW